MHLGSRMISCYSLTGHNISMFDVNEIDGREVIEYTPKEGVELTMEIGTGITPVKKVTRKWRRLVEGTNDLSQMTPYWIVETRSAIMALNQNDRARFFLKDNRE